MYALLELIDFFNEHGFIVNLIFYGNSIECNVQHKDWINREKIDLSGKTLTDVVFRMRDCIEHILKDK